MVNVQVQSLLEASERGLAVHPPSTKNRCVYRCLRSLLRNQLFVRRLELCFEAYSKKPSIASFQEYNSSLNVPIPKRHLQYIAYNIPREEIRHLYLHKINSIYPVISIRNHEKRQTLFLWMNEREDFSVHLDGSTRG